MTRPLAHLAAVIALSLGAAAPSDASQPPAVPADSIKWQRMDPAGTRFALLDGVRDRAGVSFTYAFFSPGGVWDGPHSHSADARVFVAKGVLRMGFGEVMNKAAARSYPAGSYVLVPAGAIHFDGADEETVIYGVAVGPWSTTHVGQAPAGRK